MKGTSLETKKGDPYGKKKIEFLEHVNEIELVAGIVAIAVALVYQGIWVAIGVTIGVVFLESVILVEINTAKSVMKLRKQNERIEGLLLELLRNADSAAVSTHDDDEEEEKEDPYKWHKIAGWSCAVYRTYISCEPPLCGLKAKSHLAAFTQMEWVPVILWLEQGHDISLQLICHRHQPHQPPPPGRTMPKLQRTN